MYTSLTHTREPLSVQNNPQPRQRLLRSCSAHLMPTFVQWCANNETIVFQHPAFRSPSPLCHRCISALPILANYLFIATCAAFMHPMHPRANHWKPHQLSWNPIGAAMEARWKSQTSMQASSNFMESLCNYHVQLKSGIAQY